MKVLTLYIDKWYIIGAVCIDGVPRPITPPNGDDRFWLYFYEDRVNDTIVMVKIINNITIIMNFNIMVMSLI